MTFSAYWGEYALSGALLTSVAIVMAGIAYWRQGAEQLIRFMRWAQLLLLALVSLASYILIEGLAHDNFRLAYVAQHSEKTLDLGYKLAAFWAGQEGSLLLWAWLLAIMGVFMAVRLRKVESKFTAAALASMTLVTGFFICVMVFAGNPFKLSSPGQAVGMGLNPQLQNLAMVFHPPMLFLGYAGYTAPLAYMIAGLLTARRPGQVQTLGNKASRPANSAAVLDYATAATPHPAADSTLWLLLARPWMVYSWITLTVGILLGAQWAYVELGWGGYWAWDPVENASLLPWLTGTALLHAAVLQIRRGMFKRWTAALTATSFFLCVLGTYLTRSGVIESVHAFQESVIGNYFLTFLAITLVGSLGIILLGIHRDQLTSDHKIDSLVSQEGFFLITMVLLVLMTLATTLGTLYPLISGTFGPTVTVNAPFYNKVILPMALLLAAMMATGPILGPGAGALERARNKLAFMVFAGGASAALILMVGYTSLWALASAAAVGAVVTAFLMDVVTSLKTGHGVMKIIALRHRHWGAQLAHLGVAAIVAGVAGSSLYGVNKTIQLHPGDDASTKRDRTIGGYVLQLENFSETRRANHTAGIATVKVTSPSGKQFLMAPEIRNYDQMPEQGKTEVALRMGIFSDFYMTLAGVDQTTVSVTAMVNPLINWIWIGGILLTLGGLVCMIPTRRVTASQPAAAPLQTPADDQLVLAREQNTSRRQSKRQRDRALAFQPNSFLTGRQ